MANEEALALLVARIDERTGRMDMSLKAMWDKLDSFARREDLKELEVSSEKRLLVVDQRYVTKDEFDPVRRLVYGIVGLILTGVVATLLGLVIRR